MKLGTHEYNQTTQRRRAVSEEKTFKEKLLLSDGPLTTLELFYEEVCKRAEERMLITHKLEGAHFASMKIVMRELGLLEHELTKTREEEK